MVERRLREKERKQSGFIRMVALGAVNEALAANLNAVDDELKRLRAQRKELEPVPVALPENLPELYRGYIAGLVATLSGEEVIGRASDELHRLIEQITVEHDEELGHTVEIFGGLAAMLGGADS